MMMAVAEKTHKSMKMARWGVGLRLLLGLIMTYSDMITDVMVALHMFSSGLHDIGIVCCVFIVVPWIMQAVFARAFGQSWLSSLVSLIGLKPAYDSYRSWTGAGMDQGQSYHNDGVLAATKIIECVFEGLPQSVIQLLVMLTSGSVADLQIISFIVSVVSVGFIMADSSCSCDSDPSWRLLTRNWFGYVPMEASACQFENVSICVHVMLFR